MIFRVGWSFISLSSISSVKDLFYHWWASLPFSRCRGPPRVSRGIYPAAGTESQCVKEDFSCCYQDKVSLTPPSFVKACPREKRISITFYYTILFSEESEATHLQTLTHTHRTHTHTHIHIRQINQATNKKKNSNDSVSLTRTKLKCKGIKRRVDGPNVVTWQ